MNKIYLLKQNFSFLC